MFSLNDKVVYPGHGVAQITRIIEKIVAGQTTNYFELKFISKDMTVLVPTQSVGAMPIRPLSSREHVKEALDVLAKPARRINTYEFTASCWNKRNKEYQIKLRAGGLRELSEIYRDLRFLGSHKELSFGEKNLLAQTEGLLVEEIAMVEKLERDRAIVYLRSLCSAPYKTCMVAE